MSPLNKALVLSLGSLLAFAQANPANSAGQSGAASNPQSQSVGQSAGHGSDSTAGQAGSSASSGGSAMKSGAGATLSSGDRKFIEKAAMGGKKEVALGKIAAERASNPDVKAFGQMMVDDHSKANSELEALAQQKGVTLPAEKQDSNQNKLSNLSGEQFDRAYIQLMVADHQKDVAEFEKMSRSASDPDVKAFAAKTLPTLQTHKERVNALKSGGASRMSSNGGSGTGSAVNNGGNNVNSANNANRDGSGSGSGNATGAANTHDKR